MSFSWLNVFGHSDTFFNNQGTRNKIMTCNTKNEIIDGVEYSVTQWPAEKAMVIKFQLIKLFGPSLAAIINQQDNELDGEVIGGIVEKLFSSHSPEQMVSLMKDTMLGVGISGPELKARKFQSADFNLLFSGDAMVNAYKVFFFIVKVNYENLISGHRLGDTMAKVLSQI